MKLQRMIPLVLFTLSSFMLWDSWQASHLKSSVVSTENRAVVHSTAPISVSGNVANLPSLGQVSAVTQGQEKLLSGGGESIRVVTDEIEASISLTGGDIRELSLLHHLSAESDKKPIELFQDHSGLLYVVQTGLLGDHFPNHTSTFVTQAHSYSMAAGQDELIVPLVATIDGMARVTKIFHFKRGSYVITVETKFENLGSQPVSPSAYFQFLRVSKAPSGDPRFVNTYTGPAVYTQADKYRKVSFSDIEKGKRDYPQSSDNGWIAMLQHYFVAAWLPEQGTQREYFTRKVGDDLYSAGVIIPMGSVSPGAFATLSVPLYAGPQEGQKLKALSPGLDLTIDYGWLTIIATPMFQFLSWIHGLVGNWGASIILLTLSIKLLFFPLSAASYKSMAKMRLLSPKMERIKQQYGDDKTRMNQAMMELYRTEKINPLGGCLPMLVQIPVFISLYWVLLGAVELRHAPFFGWIHDLSAADPYYILPLIMAASMILQQRMSPKPADPVQAKVMQFMPLVFSFMFFFFPSGLVLYWVVNNLLSIAQQWQITRMIGDGSKS
ncbi:MAG: membrane protein insertase YidC [Betaproteobacteria bacterium]|nr:membrane protein insertase YidC [Betaproteobacteria bacterium]